MTHEFNRALRTLHSCDVLVIGGGPAGIAASVAAARRAAGSRRGVK
jgi:succinate dehydrogenase/fumarate reductase flavoprotein subunit